jgi:two-component system sensor histidine kinase CpxA
LRFTKEGSNVEVSLFRDGGAIELCVRDRGAGVPDEALADIFRPFYRVDTDRDRNTGGSGIGLAIAQRAVVLHGGSVKAENVDGGGLMVSLRLPAERLPTASTPVTE